MSLRVVGAGLPRTGTNSLGVALEHLLGGPYYHMSVIPGHPFDLGPDWNLALSGGKPDWDRVFDGYVAAVDWPASMFWRDLSEAYPDALVLLSVREDAETWWHSCNETFLPFARLALSPDWKEGRGLIDLLERFTGTRHWDDAATMTAAYERHNAQVKKTIPSERLLVWNAAEGWEPICKALGLPVPDITFPWVNRRSDWNK
ncbi:MAG TPA: sulfotransferase [Anaerolineales bacterium]|nr:sulfotransferase [Anaerolineales bacterium]